MLINGLHFARPYEAILYWLKGLIRGKTLGSGSIRLPSGGTLGTRGYDLIAEGLNEEELDALKLLLRRQDFLTTKFHVYNNLTARIKVPVVQQTGYKLERLKIK
jgi:hypothetical protein